MIKFFNARNRAAYRYIKGKFDHVSASEEDVRARTEEVEANFQDKLMRVVGRLAESVVEDLLVAYAVMRDPQTPLRTKAVLAGALLYFISPFDAVADFVPLGLADDAAVLAAALSYVSGQIEPRHRERAKEMLGKFLRRSA